MNSDSIVTWIAQLHAQYPTVGLLLILMMLDVLTGLFAGGIEKKLNSRFSWEGMCKKVQMILAVGMGVALEPYAEDMPLGKVIAVFYSFTETISIVENLKRSGIPIPKALQSFLDRFRAEADHDTKPAIEKK